MSSKKKKNLDIIDAFDDDFEVSYEEETPLTYKLEAEKPKKKSKKQINLDVVDVNNDTLYDIRYDCTYDDDDMYNEDLDDEDDDYEYTRHKRSSSSRRKKKKLTPIAAPLKQGSKAVYNFSHALLRNLSLILVLVIIVLLAVNFLRGSAPYGDIAEELQTQAFSQKLLSYFAVAACLILYELFAALWTMSKARVRDEYGRRREDVGRGLFSFIFIYLCSYASFLLSGHIPEINEVILGVQGAMAVFGSMHNVLFGICAAGVVSCLLRRYHL